MAWTPGRAQDPGGRTDPIVEEITPASRAALDAGLAWLARNQGAEGNWTSNDLGLIALGALAFLADGRLPGTEPYGEVVERALDAVLRHARPSGLLNISRSQWDLYNHGISTFVLAQAFGVSDDDRISLVLDRALRLIESTQCEDGGWDYVARRVARGHDLSLIVMQTKALRAGLDSGLDVNPDVVRRALDAVRSYYRAEDGSSGEGDRRLAGQFTYDGEKRTLAMAAAGVVSLRELGAAGDWRIPKSLDVVRRAVSSLEPGRPGSGSLPLEQAYTLYYVAQTLYQSGGEDWRVGYPVLRDALVASQVANASDPRRDGSWTDLKDRHGVPGRLFATAVACWVLALPNRFLPSQRIAGGERPLLPSSAGGESGENAVEDGERSRDPVGTGESKESDR